MTLFSVITFFIGSALAGNFFATGLSNESSLIASIIALLLTVTAIIMLTIKARLPIALIASAGVAVALSFLGCIPLFFASLV